MRVGERACIYAGASYGWSSTRRPRTCPSDVPLIFEVELVRFDQVRILHGSQSSPRGQSVFSLHNSKNFL